MSLTRSQIAYNLAISPHRVSMLYGKDKVLFMFSSNLYGVKFLEKMEQNRKEIAESLSKRFDVNINFDLLADLRLYAKTEKRGFLIYWNEVEVKCLNEITLSGEKMTLQK